MSQSQDLYSDIEFLETPEGIEEYIDAHKGKAVTLLEVSRHTARYVPVIDIKSKYPISVFSEYADKQVKYSNLEKKRDMLSGIVFESAILKTLKSGSLVITKADYNIINNINFYEEYVYMVYHIKAGDEKKTAFICIKAFEKKYGYVEYLTISQTKLRAAAAFSEDFDEAMLSIYGFPTMDNVVYDESGRITDALSKDFGFYTASYWLNDKNPLLPTLIEPEVGSIVRFKENAKEIINKTIGFKWMPEFDNYLKDGATAEIVKIHGSGTIATVKGEVVVVSRGGLANVVRAVLKEATWNVPIKSLEIARLPAIVPTVVSGGDIEAARYINLNLAAFQNFVQADFAIWMENNSKSTKLYGKKNLQLFLHNYLAIDRENKEELEMDHLNYIFESIFAVVRYAVDIKISNSLEAPCFFDSKLFREIINSSVFISDRDKKLKADADFIKIVIDGIIEPYLKERWDNFRHILLVEKGMGRFSIFGDKKQAREMAYNYSQFFTSIRHGIPNLDIKAAYLQKRLHYQDRQLKLSEDSSEYPEMPILNARFYFYDRRIIRSGQGFLTFSPTNKKGTNLPYNTRMLVGHERSSVIVHMIPLKAQDVPKFHRLLVNPDYNEIYQWMRDKLPTDKNTKKVLASLVLDEDAEWLRKQLVSNEPIKIYEGDHEAAAEASEMAMTVAWHKYLLDLAEKTGVEEWTGSDPASSPESSTYKEGSEVPKYKLGGLFHGSGSKFDKFSLKDVGAGGKSAGGWGIYLSTSREVASQYLLKSGGMYVVSVAENGEWLDLDEQIPMDIGFQISERLGKKDYDTAEFLKDFLAQGDDGYEPATGKQVYDYLSSVLGSEQKASEFLLGIGIIGNRFKDKTMPEETNYVVFDADAIKIEDTPHDDDEDPEYADGGDITFKKKKGTEKEQPHTEVYLDGKYLGYYMPNTSMASAVDENWNFVSKNSEYPNLRARTKNELISLLGKKYADGGDAGKEKGGYWFKKKGSSVRVFVEDENDKPAVEFDKKYGTTISKTDWKYPDDKDADDIYLNLIRNWVLSPTQKREDKLFGYVAKLTDEHFPGISKIKDEDVKRAILSGMASGFNYDDIYSFSVEKITGSSHQIENIREELEKMGIGIKYQQWVMSPKTFEKVKEQLKVKDISAFSNGGTLKLQLDEAMAIEYPSGSALECFGERLYLIGDDASSVLVMNMNYEPIENIRLYEGGLTERIAKSIKADNECCTIIKFKGKMHLLVMGSASKDTRKTIVLIDLTTYEHTFIDFSVFAARMPVTNLNIEGVAVVGDDLYLVSRGNRENIENTLIKTDLGDFLTDQATAKITTEKFILEGGSGISEIAYVPQKDIMLFTAATEDTKDAIEDGTIGDSYLGYIPAFSKKGAFEGAVIINLSQKFPELKNQKVEAVCVEAIEGDTLKLRLCIDNDDGRTVLLSMSLDIKQHGLFRSDADRELWIKLNAERQIEWEKGLGTQQAQHPRSMEEALEISRNQCKADENSGKLRYSMEELLTLNRSELEETGRKQRKEILSKLSPKK